MLVRFVALFFLLAGAARPAAEVLASAFGQEAAALCAADAADEENDSDDAEYDSADDSIAAGVTAVASHGAQTDAVRKLAAYRLIFPEHHPEVTTPPPRG